MSTKRLITFRFHSHRAEKCQQNWAGHTRNKIYNRIAEVDYLRRLHLNMLVLADLSF
jgi:hypothetical protein